MAPDATFEIDERVDVEGHRATVRYVGEVAGQDGEWVGVEWDDPERGKNDGSTGGQQYFTCRSGSSKGASFLRPHKITRGTCLLDAIIARYVPTAGQATNSSAAESEDLTKEMYVMTARRNQVPVQLVGADKISGQQSKLGELAQVSLVDALVTRATAGVGDTALGDTMTSLEELQLPGSLIGTWKEVSELARQLARLRALNLSRCRFSWAPPFPCSSSLRLLVLNNCQLTWTQVQQLEPGLPHLEELHLCGNGIRQLHVERDGQPACRVSGWDSLLQLTLDDNEVDDWEQVMTLSHLTRLERLHLNGNKLTHVRYPLADHRGPGEGAGDASGRPDGDAVSSAPFASLRSLLLGRNLISDWASVDALDSFPSLEETRLTDNPLCAGPSGAVGARFLIIPRAGRLQVLNGSTVRPLERRDAEIRYVRMVMRDVEKARGGDGGEDAAASIIREHPRYHHLKELHNITTAAALGAVANTTLAHDMKAIQFTCVAASAGEKPPVTKKLPAGTSVGKVKLLVEKLFRLKPSQQQLFLLAKDSPFPDPLNDDEEVLANLAFGDDQGGQILVDEIDVEAARRAAEHAAEEQRRRYEEQQQEIESKTKRFMEQVHGDKLKISSVAAEKIGS
eukprot:jgi/Mesvir1/16972/Mv15818-RA.1